MKVLFLLGADQKYGTPRMGQNLIKTIKEQDPHIEYIVLTQNYGIVNEFCNEANIENYVIPYRWCIYAPYSNKLLDLIKKHLKRMIVNVFMIRALMRLKRYVDMDKIDLIHTNINRDLFGEYLSKKYKKPHVVHLREYSTAHFNFKFLFPQQISYMNRYTNIFIAVSESVKKDWIQIGLDAKKIVTVYDGIDSKSIECNSHHYDMNTINIVMCGGIYKGKGQLQLVEAINLLKKRYQGVVNVDIYGDGGKGKYIDEVIECIKKRELQDTIHLLGYRADVTSKLYRYDLGINCSKSEGFGLVTAEYMFAGVCPVVSNTGANTELVLDGKTGIVYEYENEQDLAEKILELIQNPNLLKNISTNARKRAEELFSLDVSARNIEDIYYGLHKD